MAYWTDDRALDMEQRRLDAQQAEALNRMSMAEPEAAQSAPPLPSPLLTKMAIREYLDKRENAK